MLPYKSESLQKDINFLKHHYLHFTLTFYSNMSHKPNIQLGCLVKEGMQINLEFILDDINLK